MQCEKCSAEVKTTGFRWSYELECKSCGAIYMPEHLYTTEKASVKGDLIGFVGGALVVLIGTPFFTQKLTSEQIEQLKNVSYIIFISLALLIIVAVVYAVYKSNSKQFAESPAQWRHVKTKTPDERKEDAKEQWLFVVVFGFMLLLSVVLFKLAY